MALADPSNFFANGLVTIPKMSASVTATSNQSSSKIPTHEGAKAMAAMTQEFNDEDRLNKLEKRIARMESMIISPVQPSAYEICDESKPVICSGDSPKSLRPPVNYSIRDSTMNNPDQPVQKLVRYMPIAIRTLPPFATVQLSHSPLELAQLQTFSLPLLKSLLGGEEFSPGLYYTTTPSPLLKGQTYYIIDRAVEPFLPLVPGDHGAKLSVFFNSFDDDPIDHYKNVPLFIATCSPASPTASATREYHYFGQYSQLRWSDRLDWDRMQEVVPPHVRGFWAELLTAKTRPEWLTLALMEHFWPKPGYEGAVPRADATLVKGSMGEGESEGAGPVEGRADRVRRDVLQYAEELAEWERMARMKASLLDKQNILNAFELEDGAAEPGLRFWWEYLQCVGFDRSFYYQLVTEKNRHMAEDSQNASN